MRRNSAFGRQNSWAKNIECPVKRKMALLGSNHLRDSRMWGALNMPRRQTAIYAVCLFYLKKQLVLQSVLTFARLSP